MEEITAKISLYHNLFLVCAVLSVVCLILAVVLFFVLDIRSVFGYLTGRHAKKQIRALEEVNAESGRLMSREKSSMQYVAQEMKNDMGIVDAAVPGARKVDNVIENAPISNAEPANDSTSLLQAEAGSQDTSLLRENLADQATAPIIMDGSTAMLDESDVKIGSFAVEKEIILIHTEEVI